MSSCVVVSCEMSTALVTVTDRKWTNFYSSFEESLKAAYVTPGWLALIAGDNIAIAGERIMHEMRDTLKDRPEGSITATEMAGYLDKAWNVVQEQIATTAVLGVLGLTMSAFLGRRESLGEVVFQQLLAEIEARKKLKLELVVCGFDDTGIPVILVRGDDFDAAFDVSRVGRAAIGSGHIHANASLAFHEYKSKCSLSEGIYQACVAKFMSEQSDGVGPETIVICLEKDGTRSMFTPTETAWIKGFWERKTKPKLPPRNEIAALIDPIVQQQRGNL